MTIIRIQSPRPSTFIQLTKCSNEVHEAVQMAASCCDSGNLFGLGLELGKLEALGRQIADLALDAQTDLSWVEDHG